MSSYDWSRFTQRINVNAPAKNLYNAFATRAGMESWFLRVCAYKHAVESLLSNKEQVKAGDIYTWLWRMGFVSLRFEIYYGRWY